MTDKRGPKELRALPSVDALLRTKSAQLFREAVGAHRLAELARGVTEELRSDIQADTLSPASQDETALLALTHESLSADELERALRVSDPPVIGRVAEGKVLLDLRTVAEHEEGEMLQVLAGLGGKTDRCSTEDLPDL